MITMSPEHDDEDGHGAAEVVQRPVAAPLTPAQIEARFNRQRKIATWVAGAACLGTVVAAILSATL